jgi:hypothetical protein
MAKAIINLDYPIKVGGVETSTLSVRRPLVRDMMKARQNKDEAGAEINLFADLCQVTPDELKSLDFGDYAKLQEVLKDFTFPKSPPSGEE